MSHNKNGHLAAMITIFIWGTTFISTKILLADFAPIEILFFRFLLGLFALFLVNPHRLTGTSRRQEFILFLAGLNGICLYYLLENMALTYTLASSVGIILSVAPFFTALLSHLVAHEEEALHLRFFLGFLIAMVGIGIISFQDVQLALGGGDLKGILLALLASFLWACYSLLTRKISSYGYPTILTTRRTFFYGLLCMIPCLFIFDLSWEPSRFSDPSCLLHLLYLGLGASALCFVTWNYAVRLLGAVKTSAYIYMVPVVTVLTSFLVLHEPVTALTILGILLTMAGLLLSEQKKDG